MLDEVKIRKASHPASRSKEKTLVDTVNDFCVEHSISLSDCWKLLDVTRKEALRMRMTRWFLFDVCDGGLKKPMSGECVSEPEEPPRYRFGDLIKVDGIR